MVPIASEGLAKDLPRGNINVDDDFVIQHAPLVKRIAYHLMSRLPLSIQADDLIQAGMIGLLEASRNYDAKQGASFETYAGIRIRGGMIDEMRKMDWAPRSVHRKARKLAEAVQQVENKNGRNARAVEVAEVLGISLDEYYETLQAANGYLVLSLDDLSVDDEEVVTSFSKIHTSPFDEVQKADFSCSLEKAVAGLPERERLVMTLYYDEELKLRKIGALVGLSESRVSQIHNIAILRLQAYLGEWISSDIEQ